MIWREDGQTCLAPEADVTLVGTDVMTCVTVPQPLKLFQPPVLPCPFLSQSLRPGTEGRGCCLNRRPLQLGISLQQSSLLSPAKFLYSTRPPCARASFRQTLRCDHLTYHLAYKLPLNLPSRTSPRHHLLQQAFPPLSAGFLYFSPAMSTTIKCSQVCG